MKLKLLAAAAISTLAFGAQATTVDWGVHGDLEVAAVLDAAGQIDDMITFSIPGSSNIASTTVANNLMSVLNITNGRVELFKDNGGGSTTRLGGYTFDGTTGSTWHSVMDLTAGNYFYEVKGRATGSSGGFYSITSAVTPVPEPESYAMLLAGLGVVGSLYRRRKSS
jgi:hypothetical protein